MRMRNYLILCIAVSAVVSLSVLFGSDVSDAIEGALLGFLATHAR